MLKTLFALLVLLNVAYFLWPAGDKQPFFDATRSSADQEVRPASLRLLPVSLSAGSEPAATTAATPEPEEAASNKDETEVVPAQSDQKMPDESTKVVASISLPSMTRQPDATSSAEAVTSRTAADAEVPARPVAAPSVPVQPKATPKPAPKPAPKPEGVCMRVGPFYEDANFDQARDSIEQLAEDFDQRTVAARDVRTWRVFAGPFKDDQQVADQSAALQIAGFVDRYIMNDADGSKLISLGLFSNEGNAAALRERISQSKLEAEIRPEIRQLPASRWIQIAPPGLSPDDAARLESRQWPSKRVRARPIPCG